jgi:hypothetical protein
VGASEADRASLQKQADILRKAHSDSRDAVVRCMKRLERILPRTIDTLANDITKNILAEIQQSDKWLGKEDCIHWIASHALPFDVRVAGKQVEELIHQELEKLNKELEDISNTAVASIMKEVAVQTDAMIDFKLSLTRTLVERFGGVAIGHLFRSIGGACGAAAGAGNLVKMLVSRGGRIIGKTFGREVYEMIGRTFTKRFLQRLNVAVALLIDIGMFIQDAKTWQSKISEKSIEAIVNWRDAVNKDIITDNIPAMRQKNDAGIDEYYLPLISEVESNFKQQTGNSALEVSLADAFGAKLDESRKMLDAAMACRAQEGIS